MILEWKKTLKEKLIWIKGKTDTAKYLIDYFKVDPTKKSYKHKNYNALMIARKFNHDDGIIGYLFSYKS